MVTNLRWLWKQKCVYHFLFIIEHLNILCRKQAMKSFMDFLPYKDKCCVNCYVQIWRGLQYHQVDCVEMYYKRDLLQNKGLKTFRITLKKNNSILFIFFKEGGSVRVFGECVLFSYSFCFSVACSTVFHLFHFHLLLNLTVLYKWLSFSLASMF